MSMDLMAKAFKIPVGNPLRKLILVKLADNANDQGECWPSYGYIAQLCECSKSAVKSHIAALVDMGIVSKENRLSESGGKGNKSNVYYLKLNNKIPMPSESTPPVPPAGTPVSPSNPSVLSGVPPMPSESTPPVPPAGTRISHSFEPVMEPVMEPKDIGAQADASTPTRTVKREYSPEFETAWQAYPKRAGGNPKPSAYKAWNARLHEGVTPENLLAGVKRYAAFVAATGKLGSEYVKQAATFFGPDRHFDETWQAPSALGGGRHVQPPVSGFEGQNYGESGCNW